MTTDRPRIGLVGCVKKKRDIASPAADLYTSTLFRGRRRWVEATCSKWFVLSAKHGLVASDQVLEPYDETLNDTGREGRRRWARTVFSQLREELGDLSHYDFEIHAGANYLDYGLRAALASAGCQVVVPAEGLRQGEQLALYRDGPGEN